MEKFNRTREWALGSRITGEKKRNKLLYLWIDKHEPNGLHVAQANHHTRVSVAFTYMHMHNVGTYQRWCPTNYHYIPEDSGSETFGGKAYDDGNVSFSSEQNQEKYLQGLPPSPLALKVGIGCGVRAPTRL